MNEDELIVKLGKRIALLRKNAGLTQLELASRIGIEESALRRIEIGGTNPTTKTLFSISQKLEITMSELFDFSSEGE